MTIEPVNIKNLESLLNRVWSGELEFSQKGYFSGTACDLAAWDVALNHPKEYEKYLQAGGKSLFMEKNKAFRNPRGWSKLNNNLSYGEADLLFNRDSTKYLHSSVLEAFKEGRRLGKLNHPLLVKRSYSCQSRQSDHYSSGQTTLSTYNEYDHKILMEFLGDFDQTQVQVVLD